MTKNKRLWMHLLQVVCTVLVAVLVASIGSFFLRQSIEREFDKIDKKFAIAELYELCGRVQEINYLRWSADTPKMEQKLLEHLKDISEFDSKNQYLEDFSITISSSDIGGICQEITFQIYKQLDKIQYGKGDA